MIFVIYVLVFFLADCGFHLTQKLFGSTGKCHNKYVYCVYKMHFHGVMMNFIISGT